MVWKILTWLINLAAPCNHDWQRINPEQWNKFEYENPLMKCSKCGSTFRDMKSMEYKLWH